MLILAGFGVDATSAVIAATTGQLFLIASYTVIGFLILGLAAAFGTHKDRGAPNVRNVQQRSYDLPCHLAARQSRRSGVKLSTL